MARICYEGLSHQYTSAGTKVKAQYQGPLKKKKKWSFQDY